MSQTITLFYVLVGSIAMFVIAIGLAMRQKWMSMRESLYVAPVLVIMTAVTLGKFLYKVYPHTRQFLGEAALTDALFTAAITYALVTIWKRTKRDEQIAKDNPPKPKKTPTPVGPPVSASELRKRRKKRL